MEHLLAILSLVILGYALVSAIIPKTIVTGPMLFVTIGIALHQLAAESIKTDAGVLLESVAELTLVILLFTDASRINTGALRRELGFPIRLLGLGLPLTILLGAIIAKIVLPEFSWWEAALLSSILAPTDAALGQAVVSSSNVPLRIRQALNVESGLNDGIAVPFVLLFASLASVHPEAQTVGEWLTFWTKQVTLGPLAGVMVGLVGGRIIEAATKRHWVTESFMKLSGVAIAVLAWAGANAIGGNGFIAAFICGMTIGVSTSCVKPSIQEFGETEGQLLSLTAFLLFGAAFVLPAMADATPMIWCYAILSLTLIRMIPVAISLMGSGARLTTTTFVAWFGPRGLASLIFALLVIHEYEFAHHDQLLTTAMLTVTLSVFLHGATAVPGAYLYARSLDSSTEHPEVTEHALRHRHDQIAKPSSSRQND